MVVVHVGGREQDARRHGPLPETQVGAKAQQIRSERKRAQGSFHLGPNRSRISRPRVQKRGPEHSRVHTGQQLAIGVGGVEGQNVLESAAMETGDTGDIGVRGLGQ